MKKGITIFTFSLLLFNLVSCKKYETEVNKESIKLIMLETKETGDPNTAQMHQYRLSGAIMAPSSIEVTQHGFFSKTNGTSTGDMTQYIPLGSGKKGGNISTDYFSPYKLSDLSFTMFVVLKTGDTITSDNTALPVIPSQTIPVQIAVTGVSAVTAGYETFISNIFNYDTVNYIVIEQGIEYALNSDYLVNPVYTNQIVGPPINSDFYLTPISMSFLSATYFQPKTFYNYIMYALVKNKSTNDVRKIYANDSNFTSQ